MDCRETYAPSRRTSDMLLLRQTAAFLAVISALGCGREAPDAESGVAVPAVALHGAPARLKGPEPVAKSVKASGQLGPGRGTLIVDIKAPVGAELTEGAPFLVSAKGNDLKFLHRIDTKLDLAQLPVRLPLDVADGAQGPVELDLSYYYCTKGDDGSCRPERVKLSVEIDMTGGSEGGEAHLVHRPAA